MIFVNVDQRTVPKKLRQKEAHPLRTGFFFLTQQLRDVAQLDALPLLPLAVQRHGEVQGEFTIPDYPVSDGTNQEKVRYSATVLQFKIQ